ncbi:LytR/AlgR family response regulator transcription factor [Croceiramulus getboli]|nr:LytTR family DNA-binding domain-containing protein [Flavobacteriaceae bacterium YJPT1-3]
MKRMKFLIVDDEPLAHKVILSYAQDMDELQCVGQAYSAKECLSLLKEKEVDLIFLDIEMPKMKGIDLVSTLKVKPMIILTTAYEEYALQGYELDVIDYLLKPFSINRFITAVNKAFDQWPKRFSQPPPTVTPDASSIFVKNDKTVHRVPLDDIRYFESDQGYVKLHLAHQKSLLLSTSLREIEQQLPEDFVRIHKSYLISMRKMNSLQGNQLLLEDTKLPVGRAYKQNLLRYLEG